MSRKYRQFSPKFKDEAVRLVIEASRPIAQVACELGINEGTLRTSAPRHRSSVRVSMASALARSQFSSGARAAAAPAPSGLRA
ncbi:transposase [Pseudonocardia kujensis]|uniref:transposase n=1 Tax=Pseudonocardia kujensis TaxID=1128675 RepID=UPI00355927F1